MAAGAAPLVFFRDDFQGRATLFAEPRMILSAWTGEELAEAFELMEQAHRDGLWLAGFVSYEAGFHFDPALKKLAGRPMRTPLLCFGIFDGPADEAGAPRGDASQAALEDFRADWDFGTYAEKFRSLHDGLCAGDIYQANLTFPIRARWAGDAFGLFDMLAARQPVRYGACVTLCEPHIVSRSPELFFKIDRDGWIETHPMKGTAPRRADPRADADEIRKLKEDEKSQAENRMIVDLLRNDISRVTEVGTLDVPALFEVETYATLHQMISRVRARLRPGVSVRDIFAALFPCGSITGAPKISAMTILNELEHTPREAYCGAIGYVAPGGEMRFNVAIRTLSLFADGEAVFNVGGGIVFDSTAESEYEEALLKARYAVGDQWISR
ncbi:MAG: aminodeoxychorismate synthase component I [Oricola sp.]